jgi:nitroreductase
MGDHKDHPSTYKRGFTMNFNKLVQTRYSVRAYKPDAVEPEKLNAVLEAFRLAPTAANRQPIRLYVIETAKHKEVLTRLYHRPWFTQAPLVIGIAAITGEAWTRRDGKNYGDVDATIAFDHLILQATDLDLGTCWIAAFDPTVARELLNLPQEWEPICFTPLGYPADEPRAKVRKNLSELVIYL